MSRDWRTMSIEEQIDAARGTSSYFYRPTIYVSISTDVNLAMDKIVDERVCKCGSDKLGDPVHNDWCPKYVAASR